MYRHDIKKGSTQWYVEMTKEINSTMNKAKDISFMFKIKALERSFKRLINCFKKSIVFNCYKQRPMQSATARLKYSTLIER